MTSISPPSGVKKYPSTWWVLLIPVIGLCVWWFFLRDKNYKCVNNECIKVDDGSGEFTNDKCTQFFGKDCSESSSGGGGGDNPNTRWSCSKTTPGECVINLDGVGASFVTKSECEQACRIASLGTFYCNDENICQIARQSDIDLGFCNTRDCFEADPTCNGDCSPPNNQTCEGTLLKKCSEDIDGDRDGSCDYLAYEITEPLQGSPSIIGCEPLFKNSMSVINFSDPNDERYTKLGDPFSGEDWTLQSISEGKLKEYSKGQIIYMTCTKSACDNIENIYKCKDKECIKNDPINDSGDKYTNFDTLVDCNLSSCKRNNLENYFINKSVSDDDCDSDEKSNGGNCFNNNKCLPLKSIDGGNFMKYEESGIDLIFNGSNAEESKNMCNLSLKTGQDGYIGGYVKRQVIHGMTDFDSDGRVMPFLNPVCGHSELNLKNLFTNDDDNFPSNPDLEKMCFDPIVEILYKFAKENNVIIEHNYNLYMGYCSNDKSNWRENCGYNWTEDKYLIENNAKNIFEGETRGLSVENIYHNILQYIPEGPVFPCETTGDDIIEEDVNDPNPDVPTWNKYIQDHQSEDFNCCGASEGNDPKKCCGTSMVNIRRQFCDKPEYFPEGSGVRNNEVIDITDKEKYINLINGILINGILTRPSILVLPIKYEKYENDNNDEGLKITNEWAQQYKNREVEVANMKIGSQYQCVPTDDINDSQYRYIISTSEGNLETDYNKGILDPLSRCEKSLDNDFGSGIASDELEKYWGYFMGASGVPNNLIDIYNNTEDTEDTVDTDIPGIPNSMLVQPIDNEYCEYDICNCDVEWRTDDPLLPPNNKTCSSSCLINELNEWIPDYYNCSEYFSEDKECGIVGKSTLGDPAVIRFPEEGTANPYYCIPNNKKAWFPSQLSDINTDADIEIDNYCIGTEYLNDAEYIGSRPSIGSPQIGKCVNRIITSNDLFRSSIPTNGKWIFDTEKECQESWQCLPVAAQECIGQNLCPIDGNSARTCGHEYPYKVRNKTNYCCRGNGDCMDCCNRYSGDRPSCTSYTGTGNDTRCVGAEYSIKNPPWPGSV